MSAPYRYLFWLASGDPLMGPDGQRGTDYGPKDAATIARYWGERLGCLVLWEDTR